MSELFQPRTRQDVVALIEAQPLAWIASRTGEGMRGTTLPLLARRNEAGEITELVGHFGRSNPQVAELGRDPRALVMFLGPHGYVSPSWIDDRTWAPTWNFAQVQFEVELQFFEAPEEIGAHLRELVEVLERGREGAWSVDEMGARFELLSRGVIGFHARVVREEAQFKLGQDERPEVFAQITERVAPELRAQMLAAARKP
jgi:predicted FMN-binding regulatory protein PaiB